MGVLQRLRAVFLLVRKILRLLDVNSMPAKKLALLQRIKLKRLKIQQTLSVGHLLVIFMHHNRVTLYFIAVTELLGACSNKSIDIGNFTSSENCLKQCQHLEAEKNVQGCQYNRESTQCSYFTCPETKADNNNDVTCWNFNKSMCIKCY